MGPPTLIQPRRSIAFPFVVVSYPLLWLIVRENAISAVGRPVTETFPRVVALTVGAVVVSYAVAAVVAAVLIPEPGSVPARARTVVDPSNAVLAAISVLSLALGAYIVTSSVVEFPRWFDSVASLVGLVIGWPMVGSILGLIALGNAFPGLQIPYAVELLVGMVGIALSAIWLFLLSSWLAGFVLPTTPEATAR